MRLPFRLAITENELDRLVEQYQPRVAQVIDTFSQNRARSAAKTGFASEFSTEALVVECLQPVLCDLAWDIMAAEAPRLAGLSQTQKKDQWNRATEVLVERMLAPDGIAPPAAKRKPQWFPIPLSSFLPFRLLCTTPQRLALDVIIPARASLYPEPNQQIECYQ